MAGLTERLAIIVDADGRGAVSEFKKVGQSAERELGKAESNAAKVSASLTKVGATATVAGSVMVAGLTRAAGKASDLEQAVGGTEAVFGRSARVIDSYAKGAAQSMGLSERAFRESTTQMGGALKSLGFSTDEAAQKSIDLTQTAADLAATYGGTTADAVQALSAAFRGEFDPLEKLNVFLKQSTVNAEAVRLGLATSTDTVSRHAAAVATLSLIQSGSADAQGRFAAEANTAAGIQARQAAEAENAAAKLGQGFLPVLEKVREGVKDASTAFIALDNATHGAASTAAAFTAVTLTVGGAIATGVGPILKTVDSYQKLKASQEAAAAAQGATTAATAAGTASMLSFAPAAAVVAGAVAIVGAELYIANQRGDDFNKMVKNAATVSTDDWKRKLDDLGKSIFGSGASLKVFTALAEENFGVAEKVRNAYKDQGRDVSALDGILRSVAGKTKDFQAASNDSAAALARWGGAANSTTGSLDGTAAATGNLTAAAQKAIPTVTALTNALGNTYSRIFGAADAEKQFSDAVNGSTTATSSAASSSGDYESKLRRQEDATRAVADAESELADAIQNRNEVAAGPSSNDALRAQLGLTKAQTDVERAQVAAAKANERYSDALKEGDPSKIKDAWLDFRDANVRVTESQLSLADAQSKLTEVQNQGKEGSKQLADANDRVEQAQRRLEQAQRDAADAASALEQKAASAGGAMQTAGEKAQLAAERAQGWLTTLINSNAPAGDIVKAIDGIRDGFDRLEQKTPSAKAALEEFWDTAISKAAAYYKVLAIGEGISKQISPPADIQKELNDYLASIGVSGARASGGPVTAGQRYLVGERGPELFTPGTSGMIHPNAVGGDQNYYITVQSLDPRSAAENVIEAIKAAQRSGMTQLAA